MNVHQNVGGHPVPPENLPIQGMRRILRQEAHAEKFTEERHPSELAHENHAPPWLVLGEGVEASPDAIVIYGYSTPKNVS
jgi:hypothetical protein